jgi:general secretion pathway protein H
LIEILIVVTLIAAISALLIATVGGGMDGFRMRSAAKEIASELRHARAQAMAKGEVQKFTIDPAARQWSGAEGRAGELPKKLDVVFVGARELQPRRGEGAIVFFEDGASSGGRIQLKQENAAWNIDVAWLTGEVSLRRARVEGARAPVDREDDARSER